MERHICTRLLVFAIILWLSLKYYYTHSSQDCFHMTRVYTFTLAFGFYTLWEWIWTAHKKMLHAEWTRRCCSISVWSSQNDSLSKLSFSVLFLFSFLHLHVISAPGGMHYLTCRPFACFLVCFEFAVLLVYIISPPAGGSVCLSILSGWWGGVEETYCWTVMLRWEIVNKTFFYVHL